MNHSIPSFLLTTGEKANSSLASDRGKLELAFIDRTIQQSAYFIRTSINQYEISNKFSNIISLSAPAILLFFLIWITCISITHTIVGQFIFLGILLFLNIISANNVIRLYKRILLLSFLFGFLVMMPAALNIFTPGRMAVTFFQLRSEKTFLIYHLPREIGITYEGSFIVMRMFIKVFNSLSLTFFILNVISFNRLMKALKTIHVPSIFILTITLSYKYIFILAHTLEEMFLALKARWTGSSDQAETRRIVAGRMGFLFKKSYQRYEETHHAMISRGFTGDFKIAGVEKMKLKDICILLLLAGIGLANCIIFS